MDEVDKRPKDDGDGATSRTKLHITPDGAVSVAVDGTNGFDDTPPIPDSNGH